MSVSSAQDSFFPNSGEPSLEIFTHILVYPRESTRSTNVALKNGERKVVHLHIYVVLSKKVYMFAMMMVVVMLSQVVYGAAMLGYLFLTHDAVFFTRKSLRRLNIVHKNCFCLKNILSHE